jgi:hypothetical protein
MTPPRLILIDGIPGSGKSTTAQRLCLHMRSMGLPARWWFEHEEGHPVFDDVQVRSVRTGAGDAAALFSRALEGWAALAADSGADGTVILESTLFQTTVGTQLLLDWPQAAIDAHFERTMALISPLNPALIYLRTEDSDTAIGTICAHRQPWFEKFLLEQLGATPRGRRHGSVTFDHVLAYFREVRAVSDGLFARFSGGKLAHNPAEGDRTAAHRAMTDLLALPPMASVLLPDRPADFVGRFRAEATGEEWAFEERGGEICFGGFSYGRLLPCGEDRFAVEGVSAEVVFERDKGVVTGLRCLGALPGLAPHWVKV